MSLLDYAEEDDVVDNTSSLDIAQHTGLPTTLPPWYPSYHPPPEWQPHSFPIVQRPPSIPVVAPIQGSYVSKRRKVPDAQLDSTYAASQENTEFRVQLVEEPIARQWNEYYELESLPHDVVEAISSQEKTKSRPLTEIRKVSSLVKHTGPVNCVRWNRPNGNLLVSASMDRSAFIWDPLRSKKVVYSINNFSGGVKDAQWSYDGNQLIFGGYECTSRLFDVGKQAISRILIHPDFVSSIQYHPTNHHLAIVGLQKGGLAVWDLRESKMIRRVANDLGATLSIAFVNNGAEFVTVSDLMKRSGYDRVVQVWDFASGACLSGQLYSDSYSCSVATRHPHANAFLVQSNGGYICAYYEERPYRRIKSKDFRGYGPSEYPLGMAINCDGSIVASGSAKGVMLLWNWDSPKRAPVELDGHQGGHVHMEFHPILTNSLATCGWDGTVKIWK